MRLCCAWPLHFEKFFKNYSINITNEYCSSHIQYRDKSKLRFRFLIGHGPIFQNCKNTTAFTCHIYTFQNKFSIFIFRLSAPSAVICLSH